MEEVPEQWTVSVAWKAGWVKGAAPALLRPPLRATGYPRSPTPSCEPVRAEWRIHATTRACRLSELILIARILRMRTGIVLVLATACTVQATSSGGAEAALAEWTEELGNAFAQQAVHLMLRTWPPRRRTAPAVR